MAAFLGRRGQGVRSSGQRRLVAKISTEVRVLGRLRRRARAPGSTAITAERILGSLQRQVQARPGRRQRLMLARPPPPGDSNTHSQRPLRWMHRQVIGGPAPEESALLLRQED